MSTKLTFFGGVGEIGGNKILLEHKNTRIFLDFGMSFKQSSKFFSEFLQPRKCAGLTDFFELGLLPDIKGLYRNDYLTHMGRQAEKRSVDAVFLSHAHADHINYLHFLRFDIPIYCTQTSKTILQVLEQTGSSNLSDYTTTCEAFQFYKNGKGGLSRVTRKNGDFVHERNFIVMTEEQRVKVGDLEVEMVPVDHSLPGSAAYIVYTDQGTLVYTGDIRFHGSKREHSRKFVQKAKAAKPSWLLCEGTRIDKTEKDSEDAVKQKITKLIAESQGMVFVEYPARDLDRACSVFEAAKANGRKFVVTMKLAYLIASLGDEAPFCLDEVKVFVAKKSWGLIGRPGFDFDVVEKDYDTWERNFIFGANAVTCEDLCRSPGEFVVSMSLWEINQLVDIKPKDAVWIKSSCDPFCDEMELDEERKDNWLAHFGIKKYSTHASGHASGVELREMIAEIKPGQLFPLHTEKPEMFIGCCERVHRVENGKEYKLT